MQQRILIVEDEKKLASLVSDYLVQAGFLTDVIGHGDEVMAWLDDHQPDLILLDVMLPGKDGLSLCKEIRQNSVIPIVMLTARIEEVDRLIGLELGADDYICKPFSPREVVARVKALFRRMAYQQQPENDTQWKLDEKRQSIHVDNIECELTHIEFQLLNTMAAEPGRIYSRDSLMNSMYKDNRIVSDRTIDSHIKKLRKRLGDVFPGYDFIHSVYGAGYRFDLQKDQMS
jgi:two-component system response regulator BaeR